MHGVAIVVGDVESSMEKFSEEYEVEPWMNEPLHPNEKKAFEKYVLDKDISMLPKTFEELYELYGEEYTGGDEWRKNDKGEWEVWSTYNPSGMWDWYVIGGRWENNITNTSNEHCDFIDKKHFKEFEWCAAFTDGNDWIEEDDFQTKEKFIEEVMKRISELDDGTMITSVDYHF